MTAGACFVVAMKNRSAAERNHATANDAKKTTVDGGMLATSASYNYKEFLRHVEHDYDAGAAAAQHVATSHWNEIEFLRRVERAYAGTEPPAAAPAVTRGRQARANRSWEVFTSALRLAGRSGQQQHVAAMEGTGEEAATKASPPMAQPAATAILAASPASLPRLDERGVGVATAP